MSGHFADKTTVAVPADQARAERLAAVLDGYMRTLEAGGIPPDVDELLAAHPDLADEIRAYADSLRLLHQMTAGLRSPGPPRRHDQSRAEQPPAALAAKQLGDYEIVREIGRGGMGIVYEARQISLNRQVALKVLPFAAMLDEKQIARFRNEAQAAAQLHHPNIVPVHAVGQERGVHFFAMQYVAGQSLESALAELRNDAGPPPRPANGASAPEPVDAFRGAETESFGNFSTRASTRSRGYCRSVARLIIQAADALQHAHEYGVIHRDVKPSNLLLDRTGKLWVTDFGLARVQSDSGVTMTGDVVGTLRYMSPEQAAGATALVDARSDVYGLGATLYEMLTLRPAHLGDNRQEVLRNIELREPTPLRSINAAVPVDLETITLRALSKSRDERYSTAQDFADDLRLFLEGKPTVARRPTAVDRATKWALRHRGMVGLGATAVFLLALVSAAAAMITAGAWARARDSLALAERNWRLARDVVDRFGSGMASELAEVPNIEPLRRRLLTETQAYYRSFIRQTEHNPRMQSDLAAACFKSGAIANALGNRDEALELFGQALAEFDDLAAEAPNNLSLSVDRAKVYSSMGVLLAARGDVDEALASYDKAIRLQEPLVLKSNGDPGVVRSLAEARSNLGLLQAEIGDKDKARRSLQAAIDLTSSLIGQDAADRAARHDLAICYNNLSFVERDADWSRAEVACRRAIELLDGLVDDEGALDSWRADLALSHSNLGSILAHRKDWEAACGSYDRAIELQNQLVRKAPAVVSYRRDLAMSWNNLGLARSAREQGDQAVDAYDAAQKIVVVLATDYPGELSFRSLCGAVLNNRATTLEAAGKLDEALAAYEQGAAHQEVACERAPEMDAYRDALSRHYFNWGRALRRAGKIGEAAEIARKRRELWADDCHHLEQVAVELAKAAVAARAAGAQELANRLEADVTATLGKAAVAGADIARLQSREIFQTLQEPPVWINFKADGTPPVE